MDLSDYQREAKKTDKIADTGLKGVLVFVLGIVGEAGSIAGVLKKYLRDGVSYEQLSPPPAAGPTSVRIAGARAPLVWEVGAP